MIIDNNEYKEAERLNNIRLKQEHAAKQGLLTIKYKIPPKRVKLRYKQNTSVFDLLARDPNFDVFKYREEMDRNNR